MAENVSALGAQRMVLQGLPQRLIQDGLVDEKTMTQAMTAAKEANANLVSHLVTHGIANAREIAIAASQEFGVPLLDLDAIQPDIETVKLVSDKLLAKHRVLPLVRRGKRLFVAVSDPTNLHALDEIKFQTGLSIEASTLLYFRSAIRLIQKWMEAEQAKLKEAGQVDDVWK